MIVGASDWTTAFAAEISKNGIPVMLIDTHWNHLRDARMQNIPTHYGEILSERTEEVLELSHMTKLLALTPNEAYNTLVCSRIAPELGHSNVFEIGWKHEEKDETKVPSPMIRGYSMFGESLDYDDFRKMNAAGWKFESTSLTDQFTLDHALKQKAQETLLIAAIDDTGYIHFYPFQKKERAKSYTTIISYVPAATVNKS